MKQLTRPLIMLTFVLSSLTVSHASFSITDNGSSGTNGQHSPIGHWEQFSTTLTASTPDTPSPQEETTITGPTFKWEGGNSTVHLTAPTNQTTGLESISGTELTPGPNTVNVKCTAKFTRTKNGKTLSPIEVPASLSVTFFSRLPVSLRSLDSDPVRGSNASGSFIDQGFPRRYEYTQTASYTFAVLDNQNTAKYYGLGGVREEFGPITAGDYKAALLNQGAPGPQATDKPNPGGIFTDKNEWSTGDFKRPNKWPQALVDQTGMAGVDDPWYSFTQTWIYQEHVAGHPKIEETPLNPSFTISVYRGYVKRN